MLAIGIHFLFPIIPYMIWKHLCKPEKLGKAEVILRYLVYLLVISFSTAVALGVLGSTEASFWEKINGSLEFAIKFLCMDLGAAFMTAAVEWLYLKKDKETEKAGVIREKFERIFEKYICPGVLYLLAVVAVGMNVALMFDNAIWGDEAFSVNTAEKTIYGILQVMYFWDNHPPLYYYWLKLFGELFGFSVPVCHLASLVPFIGGILAAVFVFRKRFGEMPAAIFVVISGLGTACLEYNLEIRMYALAFACVMACFYCSYKVISEGKKRAWIGMTLWALAAAYSHYFAMVAAGGILFMTGVCVWMKYRGRTWLRGVLSIVMFFVGYAPWMFFLFTAIRNVTGNWWVTEILGLDESISIVMGDAPMDRILLPLFLLLMLVVFTADSGIFCMQKRGEACEIALQAPSIKGWADETYSLSVGLFTIIGTIVFGYLLGVLMGHPILIQRYLYPLSAVTLCVLVMESSRVLSLLKRLRGRIALFRPEICGKLVLLVLILLLFCMSMENYQVYSKRVREEDEKTEETLNIIGEPEEGVQMVTNGVKHLGWTVLFHYYPDYEIVNGDYNQAESDSFWYFNPEELREDQIAELRQRGIKVTSYGVKQISQYPFWLYHMERDVEGT